MPHAYRFKHGLCIVMLGAGPVAAIAAPADGYAAICAAGAAADKERLAHWLLDKSGLSVGGAISLGRAGGSSRAILDAVFSGKAACAACTDDDKAKLRALGTKFHGIAKPAGLPPEKMDTYFADTSTDQISCTPALASAIDGAPEPPKTPLAPARWRVRGQAADLYIDRVTDKSAFRAAKAASVSVRRDRVTEEDKHAALAYVGYSFEPWAGPDRPQEQGDTAIRSLSIIPFLGIDKKKLSKDGVYAAADSHDRRIAGVSAQVYQDLWLNWGYSANLIALHSRDNVDRTRMNELTAEFEPIRLRMLNDFRTIHGWKVFPKFRAQLNAVHFSQQSNRPEVAAGQHNARRAGADMGVTLVAPLNRISYTYNYLKLNDWKGDGDVSLFDQSLQLVLDEQELTLLSLTYLRGYKDIGRAPVKTLALELQFRY